VGNPGAGKSTLINGIVGEPLFEARPSWDGSGVTSVFGEVLVPGKGVFMDTPGLADDVTKHNAAAAITAALKRGGFYRVVFVVRELNGRCLPSDKTTMQLIMEAAPTITDFGIIVNQVNPDWLDFMTRNPENRHEWIKALMMGLPLVTPSIHFIPRVEALVNKENAKHQAPQEVIDFILRCPGMVILPEDVKLVQVNQFAAMQEQLEHRTMILQSNKSQMEQEIQRLGILMNAAEERGNRARADADPAHSDACTQAGQGAEAEQALRRANQGRVPVAIMTLGISELLRWW